MMRLRACIGALLFCAGGCASLPEQVRIEVDGRTIELRQQGFDAGLLDGRWSSSLDCSSAGKLPAQEGVTIRPAGPDELEVEGKDGVKTRLYRCAR